MATIFDKMNLEEQREILVLNAPDSFEKEIKALPGVRVRRRVDEVKSLSFALAFVTERVELARLSRTLAAKAVDHDWSALRFRRIEYILRPEP
jgi:hypothetical protein